MGTIPHPSTRGRCPSVSAGAAEAFSPCPQLMQVWKPAQVQEYMHTAQGYRGWEADDPLLSQRLWHVEGDGGFRRNRGGIVKGRAGFPGSSRPRCCNPRAPSTCDCPSAASQTPSRRSDMSPPPFDCHNMPMPRGPEASPAVSACGWPWNMPAAGAWCPRQARAPGPFPYAAFESRAPQRSSRSASFAQAEPQTSVCSPLDGQGT